MRVVGGHVRVRARVVDREDAAVDRVVPEVLRRARRTRDRDERLQRDRGADEPDRQARWLAPDDRARGTRRTRPRSTRRARRSRASPPAPTTIAVARVVTTSAPPSSRETDGRATGEGRTAGPGPEGSLPRPGPTVRPTAVEGPCGCDRRTVRSSSSGAEPPLNRDERSDAGVDREHDGERGAGRVLDRDRAAVRDHDVVDDGEAEPGAAVVARPRASSSRAKRSKTARGRHRGMPGPSSTTRSVTAVLDSDERRPPLCEHGVARGVVEQVAHDAQRAGRRCRRPARPTPRACRRGACVCARRRRASASTISSRSTGARWAASSVGRVGDRDREQVVDQPLQADGVGEHLARRSPASRRSSGCSRSTSSCARMPGERAAQLVAGVGDEPALAVGGVLEPGEHRVHRPRQATDLVVRSRARARAGAGPRRR